MGEVTLPIGTITIQETKAPEGYLINPKSLFVKLQATVLRKVYTLITLRLYQNSLSAAVYRYVKQILKIILHKGNGTLAGTQIEIINNNANTVTVNGVTLPAGRSCFNSYHK